MKYRIKVEVEARGKKWYYPQYRYLYFFWKYHTELKDISLSAYKIGYHTLSDAKEHILNDIERRDKEGLNKVKESFILDVAIKEGVLKIY